MRKKLEVNNLQISFRTQNGNVKAVRNISFDLFEGETLAIVGESGSGKSVTNKAIIGILAPNSIVEGGEILYDGQDLLKISEEDFHKIRGDKISMIFQDPMSSLNPIIKVGKQLTEAMILNSKSSSKHSRQEFNFKLKQLNKYLDVVYPTEEEKTRNKEICHEFDSFCIESLKLEADYHNALNNSIGLVTEIEKVLFLIEKKQKISYIKTLKQIKKTLPLTYNACLTDSKIGDDFIARINTLLPNSNKVIAATEKKPEITEEQIISLISDIKEYLETVNSKEIPNYFTLGYYFYKNPEATVDYTNIEALNKFNREYIDSNFMLQFLDLSSKAIECAYKASCDRKKQTLSVAEKYLADLQHEIEKKEIYSATKELTDLVENQINSLDIRRNSAEYSFKNATYSILKRYFDGVKNNPINQKKYEDRKAKFEELVKSGKTPTWKVVPPTLVDLEITKQTLISLVTKLIESIKYDITKLDTMNFAQEAVNLVDIFKELAEKVVQKVTKKIAKARAIKLLEEVGIPEPHIRYNQYPFEFSGGMRQRIVIAIALSANPDILICDEPTTALDVTIQSQILELINRIKVERNLSVIFITHDLGVVANMADRIAVMYAGKIVEYGTADDIFYDPKHPYTWALLSSMPDLDTKDKLEAIPGTPPNMIFPPKGDAFAERNKYALEIDYEIDPPLFEISDTHYAATWLLHPNAPKVNPPKAITDRIERMKKKEAEDHE